MVLPLADDNPRGLSHFFQKRQYATQQGNASKGMSLDELEAMIQWLMQISVSLAYLHSITMEGKPYVHRDLKFDNILFWNNKAYLCDFGTVKRVQNRLTTSSSFFPEK